MTMVEALRFLELLIGYVLCGLIALLGLVVVWKVWTDKIDLSLLISEKTGEASMSRFQLLIFTFVVALSFFLIVVANVKIAQADLDLPKSPGTSVTSTVPSPPSMPEIPGGVLSLLGISASSYLVSKGIQRTKDEEVAEAVASRSHVTTTTSSTTTTRPPTQGD